jgi:DNA-binding response OmpR family regulator
MLKILLVEDHTDTAKVYAALLRRAGHRVDVARGYREALDVARRATPEILVSDIGLPDGDGCDLLRELRSQYAIRGIAVSGFIQESDRQRYLDAGFAECIAKPCSFEALHAAIDRAAGAARALSPAAAASDNAAARLQC